MKFLRIPDPLLSVLFEDEDILALDKPYGFNTHTNDSKIEHSEFIQDGLIEMLEKQFGRKLHIVHRLDQTTTGVIIFGKSQEAAKKYAEFFFERKVKKTYIFVTASKSLKPQFLIDQVIIHKAKELEAKTELKFLKKTNSFELWQANPFTGRNHQIRIHAEAAGIPILGDEKYHGAKYPFLCLHNHKIEFPNKITVQSKLPPYFENLNFLEDQILAKTLFEVDRRYRLFSDKPDQCLRLAHAKNNDETGFSLDQYGSRLVLNWSKKTWEEAERKKFKFFSNVMNKPILIRLPKSQEAIYPQNFKLTQENAWIATEIDTKYELRADSLLSPGLFLNQRLQRNWVLHNSRNKSVLSLFASTCSFGLAAARGQATQVISVDSNKNFLSWGKKNFELNGLNPEESQFLCRDSLVFLNQSITKKQKYDFIICEAPSYVRGEKGIFKIEKDLEKLLKSCLECLNSEGKLLFSTAFEGFLVDDIRKAILKVQKEARIPQLDIQCILPALDQELPDERVNLKSFLISLFND
jgi:23S rRNA (cytosine1962-C5)-methyltransferase